MKIIAVFLVMLASVTASAETAVPVFVTSIGASGGMTDPNKENQDTVRDLQRAIQDRKGLTLVDARDAARLVIVVQNREKAQITAGVFGAARDCTVRVTLIYQGHESEMAASAQGGTLASGGAWKKAAGKVASQLEQWVAANHATLTASARP